MTCKHPSCKPYNVPISADPESPSGWRHDYGNNRPTDKESGYCHWAEIGGSPKPEDSGGVGWKDCAAPDR